MSSQKQQTWNILLTPCRNSHPFEPRNISISKGDESSLKIGRAVARVLPTESNAIFDCKVMFFHSFFSFYKVYKYFNQVLSRNHAVIWVLYFPIYNISIVRNSGRWSGTIFNQRYKKQQWHICKQWTIVNKWGGINTQVLIKVAIHISKN